MSASGISIIIPCYNESAVVVEDVIRRVSKVMAELNQDHEILLVDDCSVPPLPDMQGSGHAVRVLRQPINMGNGAAVKTGIRQSRYDKCLVLDADGQHLPEEIPDLFAKMANFSMVVGARNFLLTGTVHRSIANRIYSKLASYITEYNIEDLTSGFRCFERDKAMRLIHLLPNRFSLPTTLTMGFIRAGYPVCYVPIQVQEREGSSHIRLLSDGTRFFLIIFKIATLYSPLRIFFPISGFLFSLGFSLYLWILWFGARFSMWALFMMVSAVVIFMMGLLAEQISMLNGKEVEH